MGECTAQRLLGGFVPASLSPFFQMSAGRPWTPTRTMSRPASNIPPVSGSSLPVSSHKFLGQREEAKDKQAVGVISLAPPSGWTSASDSLFFGSGREACPSRKLDLTFWSKRDQTGNLTSHSGALFRGFDLACSGAPDLLSGRYVELDHWKSPDFQPTRD